MELYEPVGGFSGVIAVETTCDGWLVSRLGGAYFGVFFFGFLASRLRLSLFPMPNSMPRVTNLLLGHVQFGASSVVVQFPVTRGTYPCAVPSRPFFGISLDYQASVKCRASLDSVPRG